MISATHFPDTTRKRLREEDIDGTQACGFSEHRTKRLALPVRTSPTLQKHQAPAFGYSPATMQTVTPVESDEEQPPSHFSPWSSSPALHQDRDMDMVMDVAMSPAPDTLPDAFAQQQLEPSLLQQDGPVDLNGRIPTPMQASFAAQVRGQGAYCPSGAAQEPVSLNGVANMGHVHTNAFEDRTVPRTMQPADIWSSTVTHRIPSPIAEGDSQNSSVDGSSMCIDGHNDAPFPRHGDMGMVEDSSSVAFPNNHPRQPGNYEPYVSDDGLPESTSAPATPSPGRSRGHIRSKHTLNSWTCQPGMKKSFSIGYRADCDKCRDKVPGHFNHIVVS